MSRGEPMLVGLPGEVQREIALRLDGAGLCRVGATCRALLALAHDDEIWRALTLARFRVSRTVMRSRRLLAAGGASWRNLYSQWAIAQRMPKSRVSGPSFPAIARGRIPGALAWVTVHSADDCRLRHGVVRLRVILQNIRPGRASMVVYPRALSVLLANGSYLRADGDTRPSAGYVAAVASACVEKVNGSTVEFSVDSRTAPLYLRKDEFAVMRLSVRVPDGSYEVDALERLVSINAQIRWGEEEPVSLRAMFRDKVLWEMYELLPGGSWVRSNPMSSHA